MGPERLLSPSLLDIISPVFALTLVILVPAVFAVYFIYRVVTSK